MGGLDLFMFAVNVGLATHWFVKKSFGWGAFFVALAVLNVLNVLMVMEV